MKLPTPDVTKEDRLKLCLDGLSLGDAFGEMFFGAPRSARDAIRTDRLPPGRWWYTDDTEMALAIAEVLKLTNEINQDMLAERFAIRFLEEPDRGYGKGTRAFCEWLNRGVSWQQAAALTFKGGSKGNGSAMRVAPVGAYFADAELALVAREAQKSAEVTHRHAEGVAGAIAVAIAAAIAWQMRELPTESAAKAIFEALLTHVPDGETLQGIRKASEFDFKLDPEHAAKILGNGTLVTCPDTVPYVIWSACRNLDNYTEAILDTLAGGGDTDTNCAMVGGIVSLYAQRNSIPALWLERREPLKFI
jgi:ADP-ribosylglycohydrolase